MKLEYSAHWILKKNYRKDITDDVLEYALLNSDPVRDRKWSDLLNVLCKIPPSGRLLKVVYKRESKQIKIITAYWVV